MTADFTMSGTGRQQVAEAYPLYWPDGWPRTAAGKRTHSLYKLSLARSMVELMDEVYRLGGRQAVLSTNVPTRRDGLPYASMREPDDPGVAVYFLYRGKQRCFACDKWRTVRENVRALSMAISALRSLERCGVTEMLDRAFAGFMALPDPERTKSWWNVLGVPREAGREQIETAYRELARLHHPDKENGNGERMAEINEAVRRAREAVTI